MERGKVMEREGGDGERGAGGDGERGEVMERER